MSNFKKGVLVGEEVTDLLNYANENLSLIHISEPTRPY